MALGMLQTFPQVPQLFRSVFKSTHELSHLSGVVPPQLRTQVGAPATFAQNGAAMVHFLPQPPQFSGLVVSVSQTSAGLVEQWAGPAAHPSAGATHRPPCHCTGPGLTLGRPGSP